MTAQVNSFSNIQSACSKGGHTFSTLKGFPLVPLFSPKVLQLQGNSFLGGGVTTRSMKMLVFRKLEAKVKKLKHGPCHEDRANKPHLYQNQYDQPH